ncbi:helix-turn-helix transcriptional regulator [Agathobaculum sp. NTUH-O15-33]|uniref:helix-turn-helix domain-containing protein n=1 Tax=Agathobaculum sp. NTUH-O15-33 TaxID=3079302 RepID=UPI0029585FD2|nr:helix-turn-helix transcriptional regulator [Agathobaculum sp. NTUH-O15-33]WNX83467.1 helix-turn-helix transcriptional regulator [Agathobaculum sp. NTUH-O15-33]
MNHLKLEDLGKRIAKLRKERHMTLKQLSDATGISVGFLSKIENGVCNPSISNVQKICYAMQVTVNELTALKKEDELLSTILKHESYVLRKEKPLPDLWLWRYVPFGNGL